MVRAKVSKALRRAGRTPAPSRAVSQITTAPVSIGNSIRGSRPRIVQSADGARAVGRDFACSLQSTAANVVGWEVIAAVPITPCVLPNSTLRSLCLMYNHFKVNKITVHYITSSPTSQAGDVLFYYERDAHSPFLDYTNNSFLPTVLSDSNTIVGPQWTNHSALLKPAPEWKTTNYGMNTDLNEDKAGTLFFFSKTNAANSPGYLLIDYDITFREMALTPRAGLIPFTDGLGVFTCLTSATTATAANGATFAIAGKNVAGATVTTNIGIINKPGSIWKTVFQYTSTALAGNTAWSGSVTPTAANFLDDGATNEDFIIDDGTTLYAVCLNGTDVLTYPTLANAMTSTNRIEWQTSITSCVWNMCVEMHMVGTLNAVNRQSSY